MWTTCVPEKSGGPRPGGDGGPPHGTGTGGESQLPVALNPEGSAYPWSVFQAPKCKPDVARPGGEPRLDRVADPLEDADEAPNDVGGLVRTRWATKRAFLKCRPGVDPRVDCSK